MYCMTKDKEALGGEARRGEGGGGRRRRDGRSLCVCVCVCVLRVLRHRPAVRFVSFRDAPAWQGMAWHGRAWQGRAWQGMA